MPLRTWSRSKAFSCLKRNSKIHQVELEPNQIQQSKSFFSPALCLWHRMVYFLWNDAKLILILINKKRKWKQSHTYDFSEEIDIKNSLPLLHVIFSWTTLLTGLLLINILYPRFIWPFKLWVVFSFQINVLRNRS